MAKKLLAPGSSDTVAPKKAAKAAPTPELEENSRMLEARNWAEGVSKDDYSALELYLYPNCNDMKPGENYCGDSAMSGLFHSGRKGAKENNGKTDSSKIYLPFDNMDDVQPKLDALRERVGDVRFNSMVIGGGHGGGQGDAYQAQMGKFVYDAEGLKGKKPLDVDFNKGAQIKGLQCQLGQHTDVMEAMRDWASGGKAGIAASDKDVPGLSGVNATLPGEGHGLVEVGPDPAWAQVLSAQEMACMKNMSAPECAPFLNAVEPKKPTGM